MKFDMILKGAIHKSNKEAYFKREFDRPEWKYEDFNKDFLEPLFDRIQEHKKNIFKESEKKKKQLHSCYEAAKLNKVDCYYDYHNKAIDLNIGISLDEYTKQRNKKIVDDYPKMLNDLEPEKIRTGRVFSFCLKELNTLEGVLKELEQPQQKSKLSDKQIVLFHIYNGDEITNDNKNDFARRYKKGAKTSGHRLYGIFNNYRRTTDRTGDPGTKRRLQNKIRLIESVIPLLPTEEQKKPKDEIKILNGHLETNY